jgi:hypothetical protein
VIGLGVGVGVGVEVGGRVGVTDWEGAGAPILGTDPGPATTQLSRTKGSRSCVRRVM